jgi:hypothetical protein
MTYRGKIKNGKVHLDDPKALPDGTEVEVRPVKKPKKPRTPQKRKPGQTWAEILAPFIGKVKGLPPDMSVNLDHYLYGLPKRKK